MKKGLALGALMAFLITGSAYAAPVFGTPGLVLDASNPVSIEGSKDYIPVTGDAISGFGSVTVTGDLYAASRDNNALTVKNNAVFQAVDGKAFVSAENITLNAAKSYVEQTVPGVSGDVFETAPTIVKVANGNAIQAYDSVTVEAKNNMNLYANNRVIRALGENTKVNLNAKNIYMNAYAEHVDAEGFKLADDAAIKVTGGAKLVVNATEDVVLDAAGSGELFTGIKAEKSNVEVYGKNVDINVSNADGEVRGVNAREGSTIKLGNEATETVSVVVKGQDGYGILAQDLKSKVIVDGKALEITGTGDVVGILAQNRTEGYPFMNDDAEVEPTKLVASVVVGENTTTNIKIAGENGIGIGAMSDGIVDVKGNLFVTAENAILARGNAIVNVNEAGNKTVQLDGDIFFDYDQYTSGSGIDADVNVKLTNENSWLKGNIQKDDVPAGVNGNVTGMNLELSNGATWVTDEASFVNNLEVNNGKIVIEGSERGLFVLGSAPAITVDTLTGSGMEVELANGKAEAGTIVVENEVDPEMYVGVTTYGVSMNTKEANAKGKYIVQAAGEGIVDQINAKDTFISGDVVFKADKAGKLEVAETTLKGDLNVAGKLNAADVVVGDVSITDKFAEVDGKFEAAKEQLKEAEKYVAEKFEEVEAGYKTADAELQANINAEAQAREEADNQLQANIDAEAQARQEADIRLQEQIDANAANIAANASNIEKNAQDIAKVEADYKAADALLSDAIENVAGDVADTKAQVEDNKAAIEQNAQDIANETAAREAADKQLQQKLDKESVDRQIADAKERAERAEADANLQANIDQEVADRKAAVQAEAEAREAADKAIREDMTNAVNRLDNRIDKVDAKIDKVGAMAAAMASLKTMGYDPEAPTEIAVGVGQYRNETGIAIGAFHYPNKNFMLNFSLSTAGDEVMGGVGATWKIGRKK